GAGADLPEREVRAAGVAHAGIHRRPYGATSHLAALDAARSTRQMRIDEFYGVILVPYPRVAAIQAGLPPPGPEMLEARVDAPGISQKDRCFATEQRVCVEDAVGRPAYPNVVAIVDLPTAGLGRVARRALRVDEIRTD